MKRWHSIWVMVNDGNRAEKPLHTAYCTKYTFVWNDCALSTSTPKRTQSSRIQMTLVERMPLDTRALYMHATLDAHQRYLFTHYFHLVRLAKRDVHNRQCDSCSFTGDGEWANIATHFSHRHTNYRYIYVFILKFYPIYFAKHWTENATLYAQNCTTVSKKKPQNHWENIFLFTIK